MDEGQKIGARLREIRSWRQLSLQVTADLAGVSYGYLGQIERGEKPVSKRSTLEALANALRVSPTELTGKPWAPTDPVGSDGHAALSAIEAALDMYELGVDPDVGTRPWPELAADVERLNDQRAQADYAAQGALLPQLLAELHASYFRQPERRPDALVGLIQAYHSAAMTTKYLGGRGLPLLAARLAEQCARELDRPEWLGYAVWLRGGAAGTLCRAQQYTRSVRMAEELSGSVDDSNVAQAYGMLHLSASLAAAAQGDRETMTTHLDEAEAVAKRMDTNVGRFGRLWFGSVNVGIWRVALSTELGDGPKVAEIARDVQPEQIPWAGRQANFYADLGRALATDRETEDKALEALLYAEKLAPQLVRNDVFVRETVADLLRRARREAGGRELRGLAWRMGVAPTG